MADLVTHMKDTQTHRQSEPNGTPGTHNCCLFYQWTNHESHLRKWFSCITAPPHHHNNYNNHNHPFCFWRRFCEVTRPFLICHSFIEAATSTTRGGQLSYLYTPYRK
jgi:hypothetical protein